MAIGEGGGDGCGGGEKWEGVWGRDESEKFSYDGDFTGEGGISPFCSGIISSQIQRYWLTLTRSFQHKLNKPIIEKNHLYQQ